MCNLLSSPILVHGQPVTPLHCISKQPSKTVLPVVSIGPGTVLHYFTSGGTCSRLLLVLLVLRPLLVLVLLVPLLL
jgi:hypothetical protein